MLLSASVALTAHLEIGLALAGKRQHYVPRLLQRGFIVDHADEAERTWLHRRSTEPKLVGIRHIGVEDWFYSRKSIGLPTLDDAITDYERDLAPSVRNLREAEPGTTIDSHVAAETVVHLVLRAAHLRNLMSSGVAQLTDELAALFTNPTRLGAMIGLQAPVLSEVVMRGISDKAEQLVPSGIPAEFSERLIAFMLREYGDQLISNAVTNFTPLIEMIFSNIGSQIRDAHNELLTHPIADNGWVRELSKLDWTVEAGEDLILSDAVALSRAPGELLRPMLFTSGNNTELIVMPVAPTRILVGRRNRAPFDAKHFNRHAAAASDNFFISAKPMQETELLEQIGRGLSDVLDSSVEKAIREAEQARKLTDCALEPMQPEERSVQDFSYSVRLTDFGDAILAKEIAEIVQAVITQLSTEIPLHELDGLTIAFDYDAALASVDRGDPALPPVASSALSYGQSVAKQVAVYRDGQRKEHLVFAANIALSWTSEDEASRATGLHTLAGMLAGIAYSNLYSAAYAKNFTPDPMARALHLAVATTPSSYWAARQVAFVAPDQGEIFATLVLESLDYATREIATTRETMKDESDIGPTTQRALECVSAVLGHAANWLGHRDGLAEGVAFAGSDLPHQLRSRGLDGWLDLFGRDLAACYRQDGALDFSVVTTLSRHVERLLWSFGIYCWPEEEDDVRCIVSDRFFLPPQDPITEGFGEPS